MEKIKIDTELFNRLNTLCEKMEIPATASTDKKMADHLRSLHYTCSHMTDDLAALTDRTDDILWALYDRNFENGIGLLEAVEKQTAELAESLELICADLAYSIAELRRLVEPCSWKPLLSDEEMKKIIKEGFALTDSMSIGYNNGQYALIFEKSNTDSAPILPPYVIAIGGEDATESVGRYIEGFLNMDNE